MARWACSAANPLNTSATVLPSTRWRRAAKSRSARRLIATRRRWSGSRTNSASSRSALMAARNSGPSALFASSGAAGSNPAPAFERRSRAATRPSSVPASASNCAIASAGTWTTSASNSISAINSPACLTTRACPSAASVKLAPSRRARSPAGLSLSKLPRSFGSFGSGNGMKPRPCGCSVTRPQRTSRAPSSWVSTWATPRSASSRSAACAQQRVMRLPASITPSGSSIEGSVGCQSRAGGFQPRHTSSENTAQMIANEPSRGPSGAVNTNDNTAQNAASQNDRRDTQDLTDMARNDGRRGKTPSRVIGARPANLNACGGKRRAQTAA